MLARSLGWVVARPFQGSVSDAFYSSLAIGDHQTLHRVARAAVARKRAEHAAGVVFDRHWLTMLTVLPRRFHAAWLPAPPTILCWADPTTTRARIDARGETCRNTSATHEHYCARFEELARRHRVPILDTSATITSKAFRRLTDDLLPRMGPWR